MEKITSHRAKKLAEAYFNDPSQNHIIYNIRKRSYILHDDYRYIYRFSRREAVWNNPVVSINNLNFIDKNVTSLATAIENHINTLVDKIMAFELKEPFTLEDCMAMLRYYYNAKCYLAYYDYYLGRVVLIKERDKSIDFTEIVGERYFFIADLNQVINDVLNLPDGLLDNIMATILSSSIKIDDIDGIKTLNKELHKYITEEIKGIEKYIETMKA